MTAPPGPSPDATEVRAIEDLVRTLAKGMRALQMYLPNNPVYQRAVEQLADAFAPVWSVTGRLVLEIEENDITWEGTSVLPASARGEGLAWQLYKDGLRRLTLVPGCETEEIVRFLESVNRSRLLATDASDDLLTLLWEQEFVLITYAFVEVLGEGMEFIQESPVREVTPPPGQAQAEASSSAPTPEGLVELDDADSTPYFLDEAETRFIQGELEEEYRRDIRRAAIDALLDVMETINDAEVRREVVSLLEDVLPSQLAVGGFSSVAHILRELRVIVARVPGLDQQLHAAVLSFEERLSQPEILEQLFRALEDGHARDDEDVGAVLRELKPTALPVILAHLGRTLDATVRRILATSADDLARAQPARLGAVLDEGSEEAIEGALEVVARLRMPPLLPKVIRHLTEGSAPIRHAAVRSLAQLATPTAIDALEEAMVDEERSVRQAALAAILERGGSGGAQGQLEAILFRNSELDIDRAERRALFEAYAQLTGPSCLPRLQELLAVKGFFLKRSAPAEHRACAIYALARVGTLEARMLVDQYTGDKEPIVRSAANGVLREWRT